MAQAERDGLTAESAAEADPDCPDCGGTGRIEVEYRYGTVSEDCDCTTDPLEDANGYSRSDLLFGGNW